jgi:hypothetical protein
MESDSGYGTKEFELNLLGTGKTRVSDEYVQEEDLGCSPSYCLLATSNKYGYTLLGTSSGRLHPF